MKTKLDELLKTVTTAVDSIKADAQDPQFTPQLGAALGGLRTAQAGMVAHLAKATPATPAAPAAAPVVKK